MWALILLIILWLIALQMQMSDIKNDIETLKTTLKNHFKQILTLENKLSDFEKPKTNEDETAPQEAKTEEIKPEITEAIVPHTEENKELCESAVEETIDVDILTAEEMERRLNDKPLETSNQKTTRNENKIKSDSFDFEKEFLGNIFNKIGAVAILIGIGIFIKIISTFITFTPEAKIGLSYLASILFLGFGFSLKEEKMQNYKEVLLGIGVAISFITTYCATALFSLFSPTVATVIATIMLILVYILADKQKTVSMIVLALIGGYINPFLMTNDVSSDFLFGYYIVVNFLSCIYVFKNPNKWAINFVNLFMTFLVLASFIALNSDTLSIIYPLLLWSIYLVYDIIRKNKKPLDTDKDNILNWLNFAILTVFTLISFGDNKSAIGWLLVGVGVIYSILIYINRNDKDNYKPYMYSTFICVYLATFFLVDEIARVLFWSIESVILSFISYKHKMTNIANWAFVFVASSITNLLLIKGVVFYENVGEYIPIYNIRTLGFIFPVCSAAISCVLFKTIEDKKYNNIIQIYRFMFWSLIYLYLSFEINNCVVKFANYNYDTNFISTMLISIIGFKYSLQLKKMHNTTNYDLFQIASYLMFAISLVAIVVMGYTFKPIGSYVAIFNVRFLAYTVALVASYIFSRWTKQDAFKYLTIMIGFFLVHVETCDFINAYNAANWLLTLMWLIYAGIITLWGIFDQRKILKNAGIWINIAAICRIFIFDLAGTDMVYKLVAFIALGIILLIVSYYYNKKS